MFRNATLLITIALILGFAEVGRQLTELEQTSILPTAVEQAGGSNTHSSQLPVAPMPRDPRRYVGPQQRAQGYVTSASHQSITVREMDGTIRKLERGLWLGTKYPCRGGKYAFSDVHVGDRVRVGYDQIDGVEYAQELAILRRPGGQTPPVPHENPHDSAPWHKIMQMYQDHEEKGTPLAEGYDAKSQAERETMLKLITDAAKQGVKIGNGLGVPFPPPPPPKLIDN